MQLVIHTPGQDDVAVKIRDTDVPVSKWPDAGATLPILVAVGEPRRVRVLWDRIRSHAEVAGERDEEYADTSYPQEQYPQGNASDAIYLDDILDEEYDDDDPMIVVDPTSRVIELDVRDPSQFRSEPVRGDEGPGFSPGIQLDPDTALATEADLSPGIDLAGPNTDPDNEVPQPPPPRRRPSPHRSPRPRRPVEDQGPLPDPDSAASGGVTTLPHQPGPEEHDAWRPPTPAESRSEWAPAAPSLRIRHLLAPDPAVPAMPTSSGGGEAEIAEAYLSATTPPGQRSPGRPTGARVVLYVANLGRSVAFYRDLLGFRQVDMGLGSAELESGDGRVTLSRVLDVTPIDRRLIHLLLEVPDVQAAYDELLLQGVEFVHRPRPVSRYEQLELWSAAFRDPDGHGIALIRWVVHDENAQ
jgi:catechol 2,3-dioxygenase-like lactoylglutathione lyase family enzyme